MIKLKDILLEDKLSSIFIPRRMEDRYTRLNKIVQKEVNKVIDDYIKSNKKEDGLYIGINPDFYEYHEDGDIIGYDGPFFPNKLKGEFEIPDTFKETPSFVYLSESNVNKLPNNFKVGKNGNADLWLENCKKLKSLPNGLKAGNIYASSSKILHIPTDIYCKHLIVSYTPFSDKILEKSGNTKKALLTLKRLYPNVKKFSL
jgi:hypothetical protein